MLPWQTGSQGVTQLTLSEMRARARRLLTSTEYQANLEKALIDRTCPPAIEAMLYYYAYGKPVENVNLNMNPQQEDLSQLSTSELRERAKKLTEALGEAEALEQAIDATVVSNTTPTIQ